MLNLETHILLYAIRGDVTSAEKKLLSNDEWSISAIVIWEISKLAELGRIEIDLESAELVRLLARIQTWPLTLDVCRGIGKLDFTGDPVDEIIAATSLVHRVPLLTRDKKIRGSRLVPLA
jgi:PIN domain nuclease of toxin-antitoxin system